MCVGGVGTVGTYFSGIMRNKEGCCGDMDSFKFLFLLSVLVFNRPVQILLLNMLDQSWIQTR